MRIAPSRILAVLFCLTMLPASAYAQASITGVVKEHPAPCCLASPLKPPARP